MKFNNNKLLLSAIVLVATFLSASMFIPTSNAHILVIGDSKGDLSDYYSDAKNIANTLKAKDYSVLELYGENATTENILEGMYGADAVIYEGHGGSENYYTSGNASSPFALVGSNDFIWGIGDKMREGWNGNLVTAPFKNNIPVILIGACYSTGWVENTEVSNPIETVYNFAKMFTGAGANYYSTGYGSEIIPYLLNGLSFAEANKETYAPIKNSTTFNGTQVWRNTDGVSAFVGNWSVKFPTVAQTTSYDVTAAKNWYKNNCYNTGNSGNTGEWLDAYFIYSSAPYYVNQTIWFADYSYVENGVITNYVWNFGDGKFMSSATPVNPSHKYTKPGTYAVKYTITDNITKMSSFYSKTITVLNPKPDLVITKAYKSRNYLYITIKNQGKVSSRACYTRAWYGNYYKKIYTYGLKPGSYKSYKVYFKYRHGTVKTDYYKKISELKETNNGKSF